MRCVVVDGAPNAPSGYWAACWLLAGGLACGATRGSPLGEKETAGPEGMGPEGGTGEGVQTTGTADTRGACRGNSGARRRGL